MANKGIRILIFTSLLLVGLVAQPVSAARTSNFWKSVGTYIQTTSPTGYDILINGVNKYLNFGSISGSAGYGIRDNGGTIECKDSGGAWSACQDGGGGGGSSLHVDGGGFVYPQTGDYHSAPYYSATSTTATSTFSGGLKSELSTQLSHLANCDTIDTDANGFLSCGTDADSGGGSGSVGTSTAPTIGEVPYWTTSGATPELLGSVGTSTATIGSGLSYTGTWGNLLGGVSGSLTVDDTVFLSLSNWFATTTHASISSLPALSITESQISDLTHTTDTTLSQEQVEDFAGGMWTGNTETGGTITYQDADGTIDFTLDATGDWTGTLDGIEGANFLRSDVADSAAGLITFDAGYLANSSSTFTGSNLLNWGNATGTQLTLTDLFISADHITDFAGTGLSVVGNALTADLGTSIDISDETNLTCGTNCTLTGDEISVDDAFLLNTGDTATGDYTFDTNTFFVDSVNNLIGIGTTTPNSKLTVYVDNTDTTSPVLRLAQDGSGDSTVTFTLTNTEHWGVGVDNSNADSFNISQSQDLTVDPKFTILSGGNTGIGTSTPGSLLSLNGISNFTTATSTFYSSGGINLNGGCFAINGTCVGGGGGSTTFLGLTDTQSNFVANEIIHVNSSGNAATSTTGFIFDGSNLGIGTTTPQAPLSIDQVDNVLGIRLAETSGGDNEWFDIRGDFDTVDQLEFVDSDGDILLALAQLTNAVRIPGDLQHFGDADTEIHFTTDNIALDAGGVEFLQLSEAGSDYLLIDSAGTGVFTGIATTTPAGLFSIEQGTELYSVLVGNNGSTTPSFAIEGVNGNGNVIINTALEFGGEEITDFAGDNLTVGADGILDVTGGSGSGLDADTLDGIEGASFLRSNASDTYTGSNTLTLATTSSFFIDSGTVRGSATEWDFISATGINFDVLDDFSFNSNDIFIEKSDGDISFNGTATTTASIAFDVSEAKAILGTGAINDGSIIWQDSGGTEVWALGFDDTDNNWKLAASGALGTSDILDISSASTTITNAIEVQEDTTQWYSGEDFNVIRLVNFADSGTDVHVVELDPSGAGSASLILTPEIPQSLHGERAVIRSATFYYTGASANVYIDTNIFSEYNPTDDTETLHDNDTTNITSGSSHAMSGFPVTLGDSETGSVPNIQIQITSTSDVAAISIRGAKIVWDTD